MLDRLNLYSWKRREENYFQRCASVKNFFKPFRLVKWASFGRGQFVIGSLKAMEAPFNIPRAIASGIALFGPQVSGWKKIPYSIKMVGSGARSILWVNKQVSVLSSGALLSSAAKSLLLKVAVISKVFSASWQTAEAASRLSELVQTKPKTTWEARQRLNASVVWGVALIKSIFKLFVALSISLALFLGITVLAPLLLFFYTITLVLSVVSRFFDKNEKKNVQNDLWSVLV